MNYNTIGIIGQGFVGSAIREGFQLRSNIKIETYDLQKKSTALSTAAVTQLCDFIFICLPTPMTPSGCCDISIVDSVLSIIASETSKLGAQKIAIIKSTCAPGSTEQWNKKYESQGLSIVFNPEFLVAATAKKDFLNSSRIVLGGEKAKTSMVAKLYQNIFDCPIIETDSITAETVKYITNTFLTLKVSYSNEVYRICKGLGINYDDMMDIACLDPRISRAHTIVPGSDGKFGFGGYCFPKDLAALIYMAESLGVDPLVLKSARDLNAIVRED